MASRSVRRRQHQRIVRAHTLSTQRRPIEAARLLTVWQAETAHRARFLSAPVAWQLPTGPRVLARLQCLDGSGEFLHDLWRARAKAVAAMVGPSPSQGGPAHG
jgi:hypothetical protein